MPDHDPGLAHPCTRLNTMEPKISSVALLPDIHLKLAALIPIPAPSFLPPEPAYSKMVLKEKMKSRF